MMYANQLGIHFAGDYLFSKASFKIYEGNRIGLAGKNGSGKSTLLKVLAGDIQASEGSVSTDKGVSIGFLRQDIEFKKGNTVWEETKKAFTELNNIEKELEKANEFLSVSTDYHSEEYHQAMEKLAELTERYSHLGGYSQDEDIEKVLKGLGFTPEDFEKLTETFSGGWRMRIELAKLLLQKNDVLLLDEPTNHLDIESIVWLEEFLLQYPGAVVLVSHDIEFLSKLTNRTLEISHKSIQDYKADYQKYLILKEERKEKLEQAAKNQEKEIKHTEQLINKFRAKQSKASFAQSLIKKLEKVERIEVESDDIHKFNIQFNTSIRPGKVIYEVKNVGKSYGDTKVFSDATFYINREDRIALVGQNGQGKTTMSKILAGIIPYEGTVVTGHNVQIGYFAQNQEEVLDEKLTVLEEAEKSATEETRPKVRSLLGSFLFQGEDVDKKVQVLSGGERNRLAFCKLLLQPFNTLILDEPTNHLDIQSKNIIKKALQEFDGTLLIISHDRNFMEGLVDKVLEFRHGRVKEFLGDVNEYLQHRKIENLREVELEKSKIHQQNASQEKNDKQTYEEEKKRKSLKNKISQLENKILEIENKKAKMEEGFTQQAPDEKSLQKYQELEVELDKLTQQWEESVEEWEAD